MLVCLAPCASIKIPADESLGDKALHPTQVTLSEFLIPLVCLLILVKYFPS